MIDFRMPKEKWYINHMGRKGESKKIGGSHEKE